MWWNAQISSIQANNKSIHPGNPHHCQNIKHFHHLRKFPCIPSCSIPYLSLYPKAITILISINVNYFTCFEIHISGTIKYELFCVWLLLLIIFLRFIYIIVGSSSSFIIIWIYSTAVCFSATSFWTIVWPPVLSGYEYGRCKYFCINFWWTCFHFSWINT